MHNKNKKHTQQWNIEHGDYQRSREDTFTYQKNLRRKKLLKNSSYVVFGLIGIIIAFLLVAHRFIS